VRERLSGMIFFLNEKLKSKELCKSNKMYLQTSSKWLGIELLMA
jgi:hypothetical protein